MIYRHLLHSNNWIRFYKFMKLCNRLLTNNTPHRKLRAMNCNLKFLPKKLGMSGNALKTFTHLLFQVQDSVAVIPCARTTSFRCKVLLLLFSVFVPPVSGARYCCCYSVPTVSVARYCCCYSVCSYRLFQLQGTVAVILCARTACFSCKVLLLLFCVFVPPVSVARYFCCYSVCSYRLFQLQGTFAVILCARTACFRHNMLLLSFYVLVPSVSGTRCCCCYSVCSVLHSASFFSSIVPNCGQW
jgi:hypothetical protein